MNYYALQVKTRSEDSYIQRVARFLGRPDGPALRILFPRRKMTVRQRGVAKSTLEPVFPGYLFLEADELVGTELYWQLRTTAGFFRYLPESKTPKPLEGRDLATLKHFLSFGPCADKSTVRFDDNDRIHVINGPLKGLEGKIVKVDKRKGRAKVKLDLYDESFLVDLSFELLGQQ